MIKIDLTTLSGWGNISSGTHEISVVAKATGYRDSEKSTPITFTKASVPTGETWVLNESLGMKSLSKTSISFTSNNAQFIAIEVSTGNTGPESAYYYTDDTTHTVACEYGTWANQAYRTITFSTAPTGDLLTWLQANGTKQGGGTATAHTLTIEEQFSYGDNITVNGNAVTSPYTLQNGDVIKVPTTNSTTAINGTSYSIRDESVLNINNQDIVISRTGPEKVISPSPYITINYTE